MSKPHAHADPIARNGSGAPPAEGTLWALPPATPKPPALVYGGRAPSNRTDTSRAAAARMQTRAPSLRMVVLEFVRSQGDHGATGEEAGSHVAASRGLDADCTATRLGAGARLTELRLGGFVADSGRRRKTRADCNAIVFIATAKEGDGSVCEKIQAAPAPASTD